MGRRTQSFHDQGASMFTSTSGVVACGESCSSSPAPALLRAVAALALLSLVSLALLAVPSRASAATWPLSASAFTPSTGFHQTYSAGDKSYAHSGIDISASAGSQIFTPLAGTVRFTGAVPSGDSRIDGQGAALKTMDAVSVQIADGRTVTLMPFDATEVSVGQHVAEGQVLGTLAASGDISQQIPHLHMGLKKGSVYCDPMSLFGASSSASVPATEKAAAPASAATATSAPAAASAAAEGAVSETEAATDGADAVDRTAQEPYASTASEDLAADPVSQAEPKLGAISSAGATYVPAAQQQAGVLDALASAFAPVGEACAFQASALGAALEEASAASGLPFAFLATALVLVCLNVVAALLYAFAHCALPYMSGVWRARISPLLNTRGGGTMPKLFPASGIAFEDPKPLARRR